MTIPDDDISFNGDRRRGQMNEQPDSSRKDDFSNPLPDSNADFSLHTSSEKETNPEFDFPRLDDDVAAFRRELNARKLPSVEHAAEDEAVPEIKAASRRRRRSVRITEHLTASDIGERMESIVQRASPTVDFFVFSFFCASILGIGYILDAPAILIIGILVTPVLGPWVGVALSTATGEFRLFRQTFGSTLTGMLMVFVVAIVAGFASRIFQPLTFEQAHLHARLWWPDLLLLIIGTVVLVISYIQTDDKPVIPSLMLAYEFYLPVSAAGFGLGSGIEGLWPEAGLVFLIHLTLSLIISLIIFFYMGFRPLETRGYLLTISLVLVGFVFLAGFAGLGSLINIRGDEEDSLIVSVQPTAQPEAPVAPDPTATFEPILSPSPSPSTTPSPLPTATQPINTVTLQPSATIDTASLATLLPTPVYGKVQSPSSDGVMVRFEPGGTSITTVQNGYLAQILSEAPVMVDGAAWIHVLIKTPTRDIDGWVLLNLIVTATPSVAP